jgi:hypothetical protein
MPEKTRPGAPHSKKIISYPITMVTDCFQATQITIIFFNSIIHDFVKFSLGEKNNGKKQGIN